MLSLESWKRRPRVGRFLAALWIAVLVTGGVRALQQSWVTDDIYVTFRYCDNVLAGHGPVYNPGERSEGYTHFLWFILLTLGRALGIEPHVLGQYFGIPAFLGSLWLLVRLSARLFPGRGGLWGVPAAALAWAVHEDAQLFASGGLETPLFIFMLLLAFELLCCSGRSRNHLLAAWGFAVASLVRPDGLLYSVLAALYLLWRSPQRWHRVRDFAVVNVALVAPLFVFRVLYYGHLFPNPYYAKSGNLSYWSQGWWYFASYFGSYFVLVSAVAGAWFVVRALRGRTPAPSGREPGLPDGTSAQTGHTGARPGRARPSPAVGGAGGPADTTAAPLALAFAFAVAHVFFITRMGGDFMFARFFLPATPFLLLVCEALVQRPARRLWCLAAAAGLIGLIPVGAIVKHARLSDNRHYHGIVDEPQFYPEWRLDEMRGLGDALSRCLTDTDAKVLVLAGQVVQAYYARYPVAVEFCGLTDEHVAHSPLRVRERPGHEKYADAEYVYGRGINFRVRTERQLRSLPRYVACGFPGPNGTIYCEIIVYDRELMQKIQEKCPQVRFFDFPKWLESEYLPRIAMQAPRRLIEDYNRFRRYYFDHNPDPEGLHRKLRRSLAAQGLQEIPELPPAPDIFRDTSHFVSKP